MFILGKSNYVTQLLSYPRRPCPARYYHYLPHLRPHVDTTPAAVSNINAIASAVDASTQQLSDFHWDQCGIHAIEVEVSTYPSRTDGPS